MRWTGCNTAGSLTSSLPSIGRDHRELRVVVRRIVRTIVATAITIVAMLTQPTSASAATVTWQLQPRTATDVGVGANGAVWVIGTTPVPGGYDIWKQNTPGSWERVPGGAVRIAVGPDGQPWIVNSYGEIFQRVGGSWWLIRYSVNGSAMGAKDIAIGGDGNVYIISNRPVAGGYSVYQWLGYELGWASMDGGAVRIAADRNGRPWLVNSSGRIFRRDPGRWQVLPGLARDIGAGGGAVWIVGTNAVPGGYGVHRFDGVDWDSVPGGGVAITVAPDGSPWLANGLGELFRSVVFSGPRLCPVGSVSVPESASSVQAAVLLPGESIDLTPQTGARIWAGVWFTGENGPEGWNDLAPAGYPLPDARVFSLLVNTGSGWRYLGANPAKVMNTSASPQPLQFRTNDNVPGNGSGAFEVNLAYTCRD